MPEHYPILTALNVPTVISHPSLKCLQWSGDGQVLFATKYAVYILTPQPGINIDSASVLKMPAGNARDCPIGWFRTMIEFDKESTKDSEKTKDRSQIWPELSQDWGALSLGSLDVSVRSVACSPSSLTSDARCFVAVLNSNLEVSLWTAARNHLTGEWIQAANATTFLLKLSSSTAIPTKLRALQAQIASLSWSSQPDFGIQPAPCIDGSILALGSRTGSLIFLRLIPQSATFEPILSHELTVEVSDSWITHSAWSCWQVLEENRCESTLAFASAGGVVGLVKVTSTLTSGIPRSNYSFNIKTTVEILPAVSSTKDKRIVTALAWIEAPSRNPVLVHCEPGTVHLWTTPSASNGWSGACTLSLRTQTNSVGSSSLTPVSGISFIKRWDAMVLALFDGSFHVIHDLFGQPSWSPPSHLVHMSTEALSVASRTIFTQADTGDTHFGDANRISGMVSFDGLSEVVWVHEACRPSDLSYKYDARHNSMFVVSRLWEEPDEGYYIQRCAEVLSNAKSASGDTPLHCLRAILSHFRHEDVLLRSKSAVLDLLRTPVEDDSVNVATDAWTDELTPITRATFGKRLHRDLFSWDSLLRLRLRLFLADFCWAALEGNQQARTECGDVAQILQNNILLRVQRTLIRHLLSIVHVLELNDVPFVTRLAARGDGNADLLDLSAERLRLRDALEARFSVATNALQTLGALTQQCSACGAFITLSENDLNATCPVGHVWGRCSVTSFALSTPMVRTCIGCSRKAFIPPSASHKFPGRPPWLPPVAQSWLVEELLEAVDRCLFCGNSFVTIL